MRESHSPWCPYSTSSPTPPRKAFCHSSCHRPCPNHYSAFRPAPHHRIPPGYASTQLLATTGTPANTPLFEISATILPHPNTCTSPITPSYHSNALASHPLLTLMYSPKSPNCHLEVILIPEPAPHLKLFLMASTDIHPYTPLRIRLPPEPPPKCPSPIPPVEARSLSNHPSLITSYFTRSTPSFQHDVPVTRRSASR